MSSNLTQPQNVVLIELLDHCGTCGYPREKFLEALRKTHGIERPMPVIKDLCDLGLMRFDANNRRHEGGAYKPLKAAWVLLGRIEAS